MQRFVAGRISRVAKVLFRLEYKRNLSVNKETVKQILNLQIHQFHAVTFLNLPKKYPNTIKADFFRVTILILDFSAFQHLSVFKFCIFSKFKS